MVCQNEITNSLLNKSENKTDFVANDSMTKTSNVCEKNRLNDTTKGRNVSGIYKIINKINGKYYVGSTNYFWNRRRQHQMMLTENRHTNPHLQSSWNKYGEENFIFQVIEKVPINKLILVEQKYLDIAKTEQNKCYNQNFLAGRQVFTPEIRKKISDKLKGKVVSEETRKRISIATKKAMESIKDEFIDQTIHIFWNRFTNERFEGTSFNFGVQNPHISYAGIRRLVRGIRPHVGKKKEWILLTLPQSKHH